MFAFHSMLEVEYSAQRSENYKEVNPAGLVPSLVVYDQEGNEITTLTQSIAIIDFLDHYKPSNPPLLPEDPFLRARVLEIVNTVVCDIHPLQNPRVISTYPEDKRQDRIRAVISEGLSTIETLITRYNKNFDGSHCLGHTITLADTVLVPQVYNAIRFNVDLTAFPQIQSIYETLGKEETFIRAHPDSQPDAPK